MAPPRKSALGGGDAGARDADPERANRAVPKVKNPLPKEEGPERSSRPAQRPGPPRPEVGARDRGQATGARVPHVLPGRRSAPTGGEAGGAEEDDQTDPAYAGLEAPPRAPALAPTPAARVSPDEDLAGSQLDAAGGQGEGLEGEGLEALEPELGIQTQSLKAYEEDEELPEGEAPDGAVPEDFEDLEDEEEAVVSDGEATRVGPPIKFEIIAGPDSGKRRRFRGARMVIGRAPGVDLRLSDAAVSRRHVELILGEGGVLLRDLGSGNGTKVNGARVAEKRLEHGDEVRLGKTTIRFVDEVAAFQKARAQKEAEEKAAAEAEAEARAKAEAEAKAKAEAEAELAEAKARAGVPSAGASAEGAQEAAAPRGGAASRAPARRRLTLAVVAVVVLLAVVVGAGFALRPPSAPPEDPAKVAAEQKMQEARAEVRAGEFERAVRLVEEAEKLLPGIDQSKLGAQARAELAVTRAFEAAKALLSARRFEDARDVLEKAPPGSNKTEELRAQLLAELERAEVQARKERLEELLAAGELDAAKAVLAELPREEQASSARSIAEFERQAAAQEREDVRHRRAQAQGAAARRKAVKDEVVLAAFATVERKFASGEWERAASECDRVVDQAEGDQGIKGRAKLLQSTIPAFGRAYDEGLKKFRQGAVAQSARPLRQALELLERTQLRRNGYRAELETKLADASLAAGREALLRDDLVTAFSAFRDAARLDPGDARSKAGLASVESKAEELYQLAYAQRDGDPLAALKRLRVVVQSTDPGSLLHEKAKKQIAAMAP